MSPALDLLRDLQDLLGTVHGIEPPADVRDYLLTDPVLLDRLTEGQPGRDTDEKLIVVEEGSDALDVALYLAAGVLDRLADRDPRTRLCGTNLADFWTAVEGVSHFNYLLWNAVRGRPVTLLELEVQGEVDKYTATRVLLAAQAGAEVGDVHARLFDDTRLADSLSAEERDRYRDAASLAGRYCKRLEARYATAGLPAGLVRELRHFFRLPQGPKVTRIRATQLQG